MTEGLLPGRGLISPVVGMVDGDGGVDIEMQPLPGRRLRSTFDSAVADISAARDLIPTAASAEAFMATASPEALMGVAAAAEHLGTLTAIAAVAAQFGCRTARFPLITEYAGAYNSRIYDRARFFRRDGPNLALDSQPFADPRCRALKLPTMPSLSMHTKHGVVRRRDDGVLHMMVPHMQRGNGGH